MPSESQPAKKSKPRSGSGTPSTREDEPVLLDSAPLKLKLLDWALIVAFLALTFLLGIFPLKDTDFWWHLRTGDWIRENGTVPTTDLYTFSVPDKAWIDLHWIFQLALSFGFERGGVEFLNLAKCVITTLALLLVLLARKKDWPVWVMLLAWLPALLVLSGRMYVRPETFTLFYLCADLAILFRWDRSPRLAFLLPVVQLAWVNSQGLFVLGPILIGAALVAALFRPGAFSAGRRRWWRTVALASLLAGAACVLNPYGLQGALYPLQLLGTMNNTVFSKSIAELTPIPLFVQRNVGWNNPSLWLQLLTIAVGALSFVIPVLSTVFLRGRSEPEAEENLGTEKLATEKPARKKKAGRSKRVKSAPEADVVPEPKTARHDWAPTLFRLMLYAFFCRLSWQATRNSHQFAAVVGTITAWNLAEWAASIIRRRGPSSVSIGPALFARFATLACLVILFLAVLSGRYYAWLGEGRTLGLGEEPIWFPHEAVRFAGRPDMPERFLSFHDGYAALYDYYNGPKRKVYVDARLEIVGPELYSEYLALQGRLSDLTQDPQVWSNQLDELGRPAVLAGHAGNAIVGANLMSSADWRCVWFDPIAAVFVHQSYEQVLREHEFQFARGHFQPGSAANRFSEDERVALAKAAWSYSGVFHGKGRMDLARACIMFGLDQARRNVESSPDVPAAWKLLGQLEAAREPFSDPAHRVARFRHSFDPVFDLSPLRATYAIRRALDGNPTDFLTLLLLSQLYEDRLMTEATLPLLERLCALRPINEHQSETQTRAQERIDVLKQELGPSPQTKWENLSELDRVVGRLLASGRAEGTADLLEKAYPSDSRPWEITDRIATLRLHLGEAERARKLWQAAASPSSQAVRLARLAASYLVTGEIDESRRLYQEAIAADGNLFEANFGLAVLEEDTGHALESNQLARKAAELALDDVRRGAAQNIVDETTPYISRNQMVNPSGD